jgi:hypothetical protein
MSDPARFLSRWSRLKRQASVEVPVVASDPQVLPSSVAGENVTLQIDSGTDLTAMLREELSEAVRRQTLKAIFADPHFNVMDGLDTYIDDYSISEPIPPEMMATLNQARFLFETEDAKTESLPDVTDTPEILENASYVTAPIKES